MEQTGKSYDVNGTPKPLMIAEMDIQQRPREKAMMHGVQSLSDAELMAIIFATGIKGKSVVTLCNEILEANSNHLSWVTSKSCSQLCDEHKGIGKVKAITLLAALELGRRAELDQSRLNQQNPITTPREAFDYMRYHFRCLKHEEFWVLFLNRGGHVLRELRVSQGGTGATVVDIKLIMREGLQMLAQNMILFHNHPSGTLKPSIEDDKLTQRISDAARLLDMRVHDHLIVANDQFYAYSDHGRLY